MANFGFGEPRSATMPGLNGKLSEVGALLCREKLADIGSIVAHRGELAEAYRRALPELTFQVMNGPLHAYQFMPALLPAGDLRPKEEIVAGLAAAGVTVRSYFSPHLAEQEFFRRSDIAARIISLPLYDDMTFEDVAEICRRVRVVLAAGTARLKVASGC